MPQSPPARVGDILSAVETPSLLIDLDAMERNLARMAAAARRHGVRLRPHAKTHKSPWLAARQVALGAVGMCCQKVAEAEALVAGGIGDVLVTNEIVGAGKLMRLAALARSARVGLCVDHADGVREAEAAAAASGARLDVLVEIDVGGRRCGVEAGEPAVALARMVSAAPHLRFAGLQAYHGPAQHLRSEAERRAAIASASVATARTVELLRAAGLAPETIGGAGTGTFDIEGSSGLWNELQPGSYVFLDADYARNHPADGSTFAGLEHALFVLTTVISVPVAERAVIDAGHKALGNDAGFPDVVGHAGATYHRPSDEHGVLDLSRCNDRPARGARVRLIPGHCDPTVNLYDWYVGIRGLATPQPRVEAIWPITGRGAVT